MLFDATKGYPGEGQAAPLTPTRKDETPSPPRLSSPPTGRLWPRGPTSPDRPWSWSRNWETSPKTPIKAGIPLLPPLPDTRQNLRQDVGQLGAQPSHQQPTRDDVQLIAVPLLPPLQDVRATHSGYSDASLQQAIDEAPICPSMDVSIFQPVLSEPSGYADQGERLSKQLKCQCGSVYIEIDTPQDGVCNMCEVEGTQEWIGGRMLACTGCTACAARVSIQYMHALSVQQL